MAQTTNPISGPYSAPATSYFQSNVGKYNRSVLVTGPFTATGSYLNPSGLYLSGSAVNVTLTGGGTMSFPAPQNQHPSIIHEVSIYSVDSGTAYLLYK
jgi:hypothetical protein